MIPPHVILDTDSILLGSSAVVIPYPGRARKPQTGGFATAPHDALAFYKLVDYAAKSNAAQVR
jgi:hypothetical protein